MQDAAIVDALASAALEEISPDMLIGVGAGKTAARGIRLLGERVRSGQLQRVSVVAASDSAEATCREAGLELVDFATVEEIDCLIDGADEVDRTMAALKGSRGAVARERMLAWASRRRIVMVQSAKVSERIGTNATLAIAVMAFGLASTRAAIRNLGLNGVLRRDYEGDLFLTDNGNLILDVSLNPDDDLEEVARRLHAIPGVVEHGIFLDEIDVLLIEHEDGSIERLERGE